MSGTLRVLSHVGPQVNEQVARSLPAVEVVSVAADGPVAADLHGDVLLTMPWGSPNLAEVLARGVPWVHSLSTGVDTFPIDDLPDGVVLTCSRGASAVPIAEFVLAAMLAFEKHLPDVWIREPPAQWALADLGGLHGRTLGVVGLGGIGTAVAQRAQAFGMTVRAIRRTAAAPPLPGIELCRDLDELLAASDHLVLAVPSTPATRHLLDAAAFRRIKPGAHLVNVARGALIDQDALIAALDDGRVALATLDVADPEPLPAGHPLYTHPRVRLSPHVSWSAPHALDQLVVTFVDDLRRHRAGEPLLGLVDRQQRY
jgi:phosphoglycerate dehydrogenase-like enzyme